MKTELVALCFTGLSLQVKSFCIKPKPIKNQVHPGGHGDSFEYQDEREFNLKSNGKQGKEDGDRLVGGRMSDTRLSQAS